VLTTVVTGAAGLVLLYLGGEALVRGASSLALRMRVSPISLTLSGSDPVTRSSEFTSTR